MAYARDFSITSRQTARERGTLALSAFAVALFVATPSFASPPSESEEEAQAEVEEGLEGAEVEEGAEEVELPEWMYKQDPDAAARLAAMSDEELQALLAQLETDINSVDPKDMGVVELVIGQMAREFDAELAFETGDIKVGDGLATLHLTDEYRFLGPADSRKVLVEGWNNPPSTAEGVLGMIFPANVNTLDEQSWGVILTFSKDGYVEDDDAEDLDYDELLDALKEGSEADNKQRVAQGYDAMNLEGWAEPPHYDEGKHALYWALKYQVDGAPDKSLNFAIRVLGRRGVLELNGVSTMSQMQTIKPAMEQVYGMVEYNPGHRYADFDPDLDEIAAYGIGGLILGKVAMKAGLFAGLLKLLLAGKKFLILGAVGVAAFARRLVGREKSTEE